METKTLRQILDVPQNPKHHPEGNVFRHTYMVRQSLPTAIRLLKQKQEEDASGPFENLNFDFNKEDMNLLRLAGLLHDIGKSNTTDPVKLTSYGHDQPHNFEKAMMELGPIWQTIYHNASQKDKDDLWFAITHHMSLDDDNGFKPKNLKRDIFDENGKFKPERKIAILLTLLVMDRLGRGSEPDIDRLAAKNFALNNVDPGKHGIHGMYVSSKEVKDKYDRIKNSGSKKSPNNPEDFIDMLRKQGKSEELIQMITNRRFPHFYKKQK